MRLDEFVAVLVWWTLTLGALWLLVWSCTATP